MVKKLRLNMALRKLDDDTASRLCQFKKKEFFQDNQRKQENLIKLNEDMRCRILRQMKLPTHKCRLASMFFSKNLRFFGGNLVRPVSLWWPLEPWWTPVAMDRRLAGTVISTPIFSWSWAVRGGDTQHYMNLTQHFLFFFYRTLEEDFFSKWCKYCRIKYKI